MPEVRGMRGETISAETGEELLRKVFSSPFRPNAFFEAFEKAGVPREKLEEAAHQYEQSSRDGGTPAA